MFDWHVKILRYCSYNVSLSGFGKEVGPSCFDDLALVFFSNTPSICSFFWITYNIRHVYLFCLEEYCPFMFCSILFNTFFLKIWLPLFALVTKFQVLNRSLCKCSLVNHFMFFMFSYSDGLIILLNMKSFWKMQMTNFICI